jgi:acetylornithine deacetylase/succinyl-diaminopimelate desuccinylase-like protein
VGANGSAWSFDPFQLREQDGYVYGRGTEDMKGGAAILVTTFLRLKSNGVRPARDLVLALTTDEEGGPANGIDWLLKNYRDWIDAEFCLNADSGGGHIKNGKRLFMSVQAAEKVFVSFKLESANPGGHSSLPIKDNAIYHLAGALTLLAQFDFLVRLFDVTRAKFERMAPFYEGQLGADMKTVVQNSNDLAVVARLSATPLFNALLRTTCVATLLSGGHAENALPQMATAVMNCRMLPVDQVEEVDQTLQTVVDDPGSGLRS